MDLQNLTWMPAPLILGVAHIPRFHHTATLVDSSVLIYGGCSAGALLSDVTSLEVGPLFGSSHGLVVHNAVKDGMFTSMHKS